MAYARRALMAGRALCGVHHVASRSGSWRVGNWRTSGCNLYTPFGPSSRHIGRVRAVHGRSRAQEAAEKKNVRNTNLAMYLFGGTVLFVGMSYAAVPLYQMFCQATGYGGTTQTSTLEKLKEMKPVPGAHPITIHFTANTADTMPWKFEPQQKTIKVVPGEPALACYTAFNPTKRPITGVATYNVTPQKVGVYFTKYQCFCFDEQRLRPREEIDMPLLFWIDPDILEDPLMGDVRNITLSYTFFKTEEEDEEEDGAADGAVVPVEGVAKQRIEQWKKEAQLLTGVDMGTGKKIAEGQDAEQHS